MDEIKKRYPRTILATACVPWAKDFEFDEENFRRGVDLYMKNGFRNIYIFGTAGEGYAVSREQFTSITKAFLDEMRKTPGTEPMIGVISLSESEIIERIEIAMSLGANDFQISFPSWAALRDEETVIFLKNVCARFPSARFLHYNNGTRSRKMLPVSQYKRLAEEIPNLVAVKNINTNIAEIQRVCSQELPIEFYCGEFCFGYVSMARPIGYLLSAGMINLKRAWEYFGACERRDIDLIVTIHSEFEAVLDLMFEHVPNDRIDSAYDKLFVKYNLPDFPQRLYPPYEGVSDEQFNRFAEAVHKRFPEWS